MTPGIPWSEEAEVAVLSSVLMDSRRSLDLCIQAGITADHFFSRNHAKSFQVALGMEKEGLPIDTTTFTIKARQGGILEEIGGIYGITQLALGLPTSAHVEHFIGVLVEKYQARRLIELCTEAIQSATESRDALPMLEEGLFALASGAGRQENELRVGVEEFVAEIDLRDKGVEAVVGLPVSLGAWKRSFGGLLPSRMYAIGGRPGAGKSALCEQLTLDVLTQGKRVLFVTRELRRDRVIGRLASKLAEVNYAKFLRNHSSQVDRDNLRKAAADILNTKLFLVNPSHMTGAMLRSLMRRAHRREAIDLVVVDYAQKLDCERGMDRFQAVSRNSEEISKGIVETGIPALVVVQLNRESEKAGKRRPQMSDIKESGQIEQDADCIAMLWQDGSDEDGDDASMTRRTLSITKNRDGACDVDEKLWFTGATMTFKDRK